MQPPSVISDRYLIGSDGALPPNDQGDVVRHDVAVANVLRRCVESHHDMRALRTLVADVQRHDRVRALSDVAVVDLVVRLVCCGRLRLVTTVRLPLVRGVPVEVLPASAAAPLPTSSAPRSARAESVVPSFSADLDAATLVAVLLDASKDGTPFCEECTRAVRAA